MSVAATIGVMGAALVALRVGSLLLSARPLPPAWERGLRHVPLAVLSALVATGLTGSGAGDDVERWAAALGAAVVARRTRRMWAGIVVGLGLFWLVAFVR